MGRLQKPVEERVIPAEEDKVAILREVLQKAAAATPVRKEDAEKSASGAHINAQEEARVKAEEDAKLKAEEEARLKAETKAKAEEDARIKAEEEARLKSEEEAKLKEEDARLK